MEDLCALDLGASSDAAAGRASRHAWAEPAQAVLSPLLAGAASLAASWERWINPLVDSGREMDVPWRLNQGERLYHGITCYYGPLGPWVNAFALRLLGTRWIVLHAICLVLSVAIFALVYQLTRQAGGRLAAVTATTLAAALCMGAPNGGAFIFPYSSSNLLALAGALLALWLACLPPRPLRLIIAGLGLAVALAARIEVGIAAAVALAMAGVWSRPRRQTARQSLAVVGMGLLVAGALYAVALWGLQWREILYDGPLIHLKLPHEWRRLYLDSAGLEAPVKGAGGALASLALDAGLVVLLGYFALPAAAAKAAATAATTAATTAQAADRPGGGGEGGEGRASSADPVSGGRPRPRYLFAVTMLALLAAYLESSYADPFKNLPPFTLALPLVAVAAAVALLRRPLAGGQQRARFLLFAFSGAIACRVVLGLSIGPKMSPYSTLPLPCLLATIAVLAFDGLAPRLPDPAIFRRRLVALLAVIAAIFLYRIDHVDHRPGTTVLETSAGALCLPRREARVFRQTLRYLRDRAHPGDALTAFPESGFFNFLTGMRSPLRQDQMFPGVLYGEREVEAARLIRRAGPRFVLLCNRSTAEYGPASFGSDYDILLWREVERDYALAASFGWARPTAQVGAGRFFVRVYERLPPSALPEARKAKVARQATRRHEPPRGDLAPASS